MHETVSTVNSELQNYADRGIFQNFSVKEAANGNSAEFRFHWLAESAFHLSLNAEKGQLELKDVLPSVPFRSSMDKAFRIFLIERCGQSVPEHRRLDRDRFSFSCRNRRQKLSIIIGFSQGDSAAVAKTAINLLHEIFNNFLMEGPYQNYMVEVFNVPEE